MTEGLARRVEALGTNGCMMMLCIEVGRPYSAPEPQSGGSWTCKVNVTFDDDTRQIVSVGRDSVEALASALRATARSLREIAAFRGLVIEELDLRDLELRFDPAG